MRKPGKTCRPADRIRVDVELDRDGHRGCRNPCPCPAGLLDLARRLARRCARHHPLRLVTSDDVAEALSRYGHGPCALGHAAGLLFRSPEWVLTCFRVRSRRPASRRREIKVWRLARAKDSCAAKPAAAPLPGGR